MRVELRPPTGEGEGEPDLVATADWDGRSVLVEAADDATRAAVTHAFRSTPVVTDDGAYRRRGASGPAVVPPGDLTWFRAAALVRVPAETGLHARLIPGIATGGFDPAANYRPLEEQLERLDAKARGA
jgi:hypothetical protein